MAFRVRHRLAFAFAILSAGCASLLALDEITYDGRSVDSGAEADAATESSSSADGGAADGATDAMLTCDADLDNDRANCGRCNRDCGPTMQCSNRICEPLTVLDSAEPVGAVAADAVDLYFVGGATIKRCRKTVVSPRADAREYVCVAQVFAQTGAQPYGLSIAMGLVAWTAELTGELWSCPAGASCASPTPLDVSPGSGPFAVALAPDKPEVYWSRLSPSDAGPAGVLRCSTTGCVREFINTALTPTALAYSDGLLAWADQAGGFVHACNPSNCTQVVSVPATQPKSVAVDAQRVYWADTSGIGLCERRDCLTTVKRLAMPGRQPWRIAIDDAFVYWTVPGGGAVDKNGRVEYCEKANCTTAMPLAIAQTHPTDLVADGTAVYFTDDLDQTIRRVPRP